MTRALATTIHSVSGTPCELPYMAFIPGDTITDTRQHEL